MYSCINQLRTSCEPAVVRRCHVRYPHSTSHIAITLSTELKISLFAFRPPYALLLMGWRVIEGPCQASSHDRLIRDRVSVSSHFIFIPSQLHSTLTTVWATAHPRKAPFPVYGCHVFTLRALAAIERQFTGSNHHRHIRTHPCFSNRIADLRWVTSGAVDGSRNQKMATSRVLEIRIVLACVRKYRSTMLPQQDGGIGGTGTRLDPDPFPRRERLVL